MRNYENLSDYEFEELVRDLMRADGRGRYEHFARGADMGVDLRRHDKRNRLHVVQCKHYVRTTFPKLLRAAKREAKALQKLAPSPHSYLFVTTLPLTPLRKAKLAAELRPWVKRQSQILGLQDIEGLLTEFPRVERQHIKLWLSGGSQLDALIRAGTYNRSRALIEGINETLPLYVQNRKFHDAKDMLTEHGVCIVAGPPGIGKTVLARMLLADAVAQEFEPIEVSEDIEEAWSVHDPRVPQAFYYDDFLGRAALGDKLRKNEDRRLVDFMRLCRRTTTSVFVLTTREYILQQAQLLHEALELHNLETRRVLLELEDYSRLERGLILYNHLYHSDSVPLRARRQMSRERRYFEVIDHPNYNPRLIEYITGLGAKRLGSAETRDYVSFALGVLDQPTQIWRHAFEDELTPTERALLLVLITLPESTRLADLNRAFMSHCDLLAIDPIPRALERTLRVLELTFLRLTRRSQTHYVSVSNPSVVDFLLSYLDDDPGQAEALVRSAVFFEQIERLWALGTSAAPDANPRRRLAYALREAQHDVSEAVMRTYEESPPDSGPYSSPHFSAEGRLRFAAMISESGDEVPQAYERWIATEFARLESRWSRGQGYRDDALDLARLLKAAEIDGVSGERVVRALKQLLCESPNTPRDFLRIAELRDIDGNAFSIREWSDLQDEFASFAADRLEEAALWFDTIEEFEALDESAEAFAVHLDSGEWDQAERTVREAIAEAEREAEAEWEREDETPSWMKEHQVEMRQIDALFARLP